MLNCYVIKLHIKETKTYTQITMHSHTINLIPPPKKTFQASPLKRSDLNLLFCMTIRELLTLAAPELLLANIS